MPRLDAERVALWRRWSRTAAEIERRIDVRLQAQCDGLPLAWFEVLSALAANGGTRRVHELVEQLVEVPSSFSRRLDRLEDEGYVERCVPPGGRDRRAVAVRLTADGRAVWRAALVIFRRAIQAEFNTVITDTDLVALTRVLGKLPTASPDLD